SLLSTRYAGCNADAVYLLGLFVTPPAHQQQKSVVKAAKSDRTLAKARTKRTADNLPVHSFQTLLADLGTIAHNEIMATMEGASWVFDKITQPTIVQQKALDLLGVSLICTQ
ncbi:hypothetical protein QUB14_26875, partial [Microcoleus sp. B3-D2]